MRLSDIVNSEVAAALGPKRKGEKRTSKRVPDHKRREQEEIKSSDEITPHIHKLLVKHGYEHTGSDDYSDFYRHKKSVKEMHPKIAEGLKKHLEKAPAEASIGDHDYHAKGVGVSMYGLHAKRGGHEVMLERMGKSPATGRKV